MYRVLLFFSLLLCAHNIYAQNWKPIQSGIKRYYANTSLKGVRVDSVTVDGTDTMLHLFHSARGSYFALSGQLDSNGGSWLGKTITYKSDDIALTPTFWGDTVCIKYNANLGDSWMFYNDTSSRYYTAMIAAVDTATLLEMTDSIKMLTLTAWKNGVINASDSMHQKQIILSKNHGFAATFAVYLFPFHPMDKDYYEPENDYLMNATDINHIDSRIKTHKLIPFRNPTEMEIYNYNVGDEFEYHIEEHPGGPITERHILHTIVAKMTFGIDSIRYTILSQYKNTGVWGGVGVDTISLLARNIELAVVDTSLMPEEWGCSRLYQYLPEDDYLCHTSMLFASVRYNVDHEGYYSGLEACDFRVAYKEGFGNIEYDYCPDISDANGSKMIYAKKNGIACGSYVPVTSIGSIQKNSNMEIFPNPATEQISISLRGNNYQYTILNLYGQLMLTGNLSSSKTISVANLPNGTYLLSISNLSSSVREMQRFIINH